jgi:hypothetical protein
MRLKETGAGEERRGEELLCLSFFFTALSGLVVLADT